MSYRILAVDDEINSLKVLSVALAGEDISVDTARSGEEAFDMFNEKYPHWTMIRDIQVKVGESNPRFGWINTDDLNDGHNREGNEIKDDLHMSAEGYVEMGKRFANESIQVIKSHKK